MVKTDDPILINLLLDYTKEAGINALCQGGYEVTNLWTQEYERMEVSREWISFRARLHSPRTDKYRVSWFYKAVIDRQTGKIIRVVVYNIASYYDRSIQCQQ